MTMREKLMGLTESQMTYLLSVRRELAEVESASGRVMSLADIARRLTIDLGHVRLAVRAWSAQGQRLV